MLKYVHMFLRASMIGRSTAVFRAVALCAAVAGFLVVPGPVKAQLRGLPFTALVVAPTAGQTVSGSVPLSGRSSLPASSGTFTIRSGAVAGATITVPAAQSGSAISWAATWDSSSASDGGYAVTFTATSPEEGRPPAVSSEITFTVSNRAAGAPPPFSVTLVAPAAGATLSGPVVLSAATSVAADSLSFSFTSADGGAVTVPATGSASGTEWSATWDSHAVPNGTYTVAASAFHDGGATTSEPRSVTVQNAVAAPAPPAPMTVTLLAPTDGGSVTGTVPLSAQTSVPADSLSFVVTRSFGERLTTVIPATGSGSAWTAEWHAAASQNGSYDVVARATKDGTDTSSAVVSVALSNTVASPLTVTLVSP